ncbi:MAG: hypothetical protein V1723_02305 [Candidatus Uhrbacteria bacterium]
MEEPFIRMSLSVPRENCQHCDPVIGHPLHISERVESFLSPSQRILAPVEQALKRRFPNFSRALNRIIFLGFFRILLIVGALKEIEVLDGDESLHSRALVIIQAARQRGFPVKVLKLFGKKSTNFFSIKINERKIFFEGLPTAEIAWVPEVDFDDKWILKQILKSHALPYAEGEYFRNVKAAICFAKRIGFPLVVKPRSGSLSKHTTCDIGDESTLEKAIRIAKIISSELMVEKFIEGGVYRITLVNHNVVACCRREAPNVIGDGVRSIKDLIKIKNEHPLRGEGYKSNFTLHKIALTESSSALLASQGFTLDSILSKGDKAYLHNKIILACGADIHDKTEELHPDNKALFQKISHLCGAPLIGIDFICRDISQSYRQQECAVIEANSLPCIDMHHYPVSGKPRDVAGQIVDFVASGLPNTPYPDVPGALEK